MVLIYAHNDRADCGRERPRNNYESLEDTSFHERNEVGENDGEHSVDCSATDPLDS